MCTLTFLPVRENEVYFSVNRDESPLRGVALPPAKQHINGLEILFPKDPLGGGSWFAISENKRAASLMNGAFVKHKRNPPYRKSRGLVLLDFFQFDSPFTFREQYDFQGIEPFTIVNFNFPGSLYDCRWDGEIFHISEMPVNEQHIWSSAPLYNQQQQSERTKWFEETFSNNKAVDYSSIREFHLKGGSDSLLNSICLNRFGIVASVSFSSMKMHASGAEFLYTDLIDERQTFSEIPFKR